MGLMGIVCRQQGARRNLQNRPRTVPLVVEELERRVLPSNGDLIFTTVFSESPQSGKSNRVMRTGDNSSNGVFASVPAGVLLIGRSLKVNESHR